MNTRHIYTARWRSGRPRVVRPAFPAVTCTAQAAYLTAHRPPQHGIVANGWYDRALAEIHFWKQSNRLVTGPKIWERAREIDPSFTCANLFWWFNRYSSVDYSLTPRPIYCADGKKVFDITGARQRTSFPRSNTTWANSLFTHFGGRAQESTVHAGSPGRHVGWTNGFNLR